MKTATIILVGVLFFNNRIAYSQSCYDVLLQDVQKEIDAKNFKVAIQKLETKNCSKLTNEQSQKVQQLLVNTHKNYVSVLEQELAQSKKINESIYYYNNKLALAAKEVDGRLKYGYINKKGEAVIDFLYDEAIMFDEDIAYAKVKKDKKYYYLDTLGNELLMAESIQELSRETEVLDLSRQGLKTLPEKVRIYTKLKIINLYDNEFYQLPEWISELKYLEEIYLGYNMFNEVPPALLELKNLQKLDLYDNEIVFIPSSISKLQTLKELSLTLNPIEILPEEINKLSYLKRLNLMNTPLALNKEIQGVVKMWLPNCLINW